MTFLEKQLARLKAVANDGPAKHTATEAMLRAVSEPLEPLYNIRKRSLPPGIDQIVVFAITLLNAKRWIETRLKAKILNDGKTVIYYDIVPQNAIGNQESIYYNPKPNTKED